MICNICGINEATIHLTEIDKNQLAEIHLCDACGQEKGTSFKTHFDLDNVIPGMEELIEATQLKKKIALKCPACKMTYEEFGKSGRLGCSNCYEAFMPMLSPLIKRVQRATQHVGKRPVKMTKAARATYDLSLLREQLRKSIQEEAFEDAANVRDQIQKLEKKSKPVRKKKS